MRLLDDMETHARKLEQQAAGFRMAGESVHAHTARAAAFAMRKAIEATENHHRGVGDALEQSKEA